MSSEEGIIMKLIEEYKIYRKVCRDLNHKMMRACLDREVVLKSGKLLGIVQGDVMVFDSEDETSVLMDFALHEYKAEDKNAIEIYINKIGGKDDTEKEILNALLSSYTSLFKAIFISKSDNILFLNDLLNKKSNLKLIDIAFSRTAVPGLLLFIRLVPFKDVFMTSGISFIFPPYLEKFLLRKYKKFTKKIDAHNDSLERFIFFFKQNKTDGIEVRYE